MLEYRPVSSSNICQVGHASDNNILEVQFHNKARYRYFNVTKELYEAMLKAPSIGSFFYKNVVRGGFSYERIE